MVKGYDVGTKQIINKNDKLTKVDLDWKGLSLDYEEEKNDMEELPKRDKTRRSSKLFINTDVQSENNYRLTDSVEEKKLMTRQVTSVSILPGPHDDEPDIDHDSVDKIIDQYISEAQKSNTSTHSLAKKNLDISPRPED